MALPPPGSAAAPDPVASGPHAAPAGLAVYLDWRVLGVLLLGFSSGLPALLIASTLSARLSQQGIALATIGLFALVRSPFTVKFLWAPLIDRLSLPGLTRWRGRRRSWGLVTQAALIGAVLLLGLADPQSNGWAAELWTGVANWLARLGLSWLAPRPPALLPVFVTALAALAVAFFSATQDIVIDAWRVETLEPHQQGAGAAMAVLGYRVGLLVAGAGALWLSTILSWEATYGLMAALLGLGLITLQLFPEPPQRRVPRPGAPPVDAGSGEAAHPAPPPTRPLAQLIAFLRSAVVGPLADFTTRPGWLTILGFVALFKLGEGLMGVMAMPFYLEIGFSKEEIAGVTKVFGFGATILGGLLGGALVARAGVLRTLLFSGIAQALGTVLFALQAQLGHDVRLLIVIIGLDNLTGGMASAAFVAYLSNLCNVAYTATQYALLTSLASLATSFLSASSGLFAAWLGWSWFFLACGVAALPGLLLLGMLMRRFPLRR